MLGLTLPAEHSRSLTELIVQQAARSNDPVSEEDEYYLITPPTGLAYEDIGVLQYNFLG